MDALDRETEIPREAARGKERERGRCHAGAKSHEVGAESQHKVNRRSYWRESHQLCANVGMGVCGCMWVYVCVCGCGCGCVWVWVCASVGGCRYWCVGNVCMHVCNVCMYVCMYVYMSICMCV